MLIKYTGKYVKIYFIIKITYQAYSQKDITCIVELLAKKKNHLPGIYLCTYLDANGFLNL